MGHGDININARYPQVIQPFATYESATGFSVVFNTSAGYGAQAYAYVFNEDASPVALNAHQEGVGMRCTSQGISPATIDPSCVVQLCAI